MFKNKIAFKLSLSFALALFVFSIVMGTVFTVLFRQQTIDLHKTELVTRANAIARTFSAYSTSEYGKGSGQGGMGAYLKSIGDVAGTDVWIIDQDRNIITSSKGKGDGYHFKDLPQNAETLIQEVFNDQTVFSEDFSSVLSELTLTVATPIKDDGGAIIGAVLLHTPVQGITQSINQGLAMLFISILFALFVVIVLSIFFSFSFTKSLKVMRNTALRLSKGDYSVKTNIKQNDEIGQLAKTLDVLALDLERAHQQSEKMDQMRRDFVANTSHELRTPITVIRGSLEALIDQVVVDQDQIDHYHKQMLIEVTSLQRLVADLLDLSKLQNSDFKIEMALVSICQIIEEVVRSAKQIATHKDVHIILNIDTNHCDVIGDYDRLRQMIMIVIDNAIKFSQEQGTVEVTYHHHQLIIKDYGKGIEQEDLPYIFERFYKSRTEQNKTGTGLGLAIAKQIADRHQIKLLVESNEGETSFIFVFQDLMG